jgi:hypothetical protein
VIFTVAAMSGYKRKEVCLGRKDHASFEAYEEDTGKLRKMAEQILFTILNEAVKYDKFNPQHNQVSKIYSCSQLSMSRRFGRQKSFNYFAQIGLVTLG